MRFRPASHIRFTKSRRGQPVRVFAAAIVLDLFPAPIATTEVSVPACYSQLPRSALEFGVLDLPKGYVEANTYMMYQTFHHLPIAEGSISRKIGTSLIDRVDLEDLAHQKQELLQARIRFIVIHKKFLPRPTLDPAEYRASYPVFYDDSQTTVFEVY